VEEQRLQDKAGFEAVNRATKVRQKQEYRTRATLYHALIVVTMTRIAVPGKGTR
jgi:hypothetical protein